MQHREHKLTMAEASALAIEGLEREAETRFDAAFHAAEQAGSTAGVKDTPEFRDWMAARAATDLAWGRWAEVMHQHPL